MEKYLTLTWGDYIVFKDSLQFMSCSLETLGKNLLSSGKEHFKQVAKYVTPEQLDLVLRNGVYPYDYMESEARFDEQQLPP